MIIIVSWQISLVFSQKVSQDHFGDIFVIEIFTKLHNILGTFYVWKIETEQKYGQCAKKWHFNIFWTFLYIWNFWKYQSLKLHEAGIYPVWDSSPLKDTMHSHIYCTHSFKPRGNLSYTCNLWASWRKTTDYGKDIQIHQTRHMQQPELSIYTTFSC